MASVDCPHGHKWIARLGRALVIERRQVEIIDGVCDSCDRCGFSACEYFDDSPDATRRYCEALGRLHADPLGNERDRAYAAELRAKHRRLYGSG